jgi:hypothetical protein
MYVVLVSEKAWEKTTNKHKIVKCLYTQIIHKDREYLIEAPK